MHATSFETALPDPIHHPGYYAGVPLKRGMAWVFDMIVIMVMSLVFVPFTLFTAVFYFPLLVLVVGFIYRWFTIAGGSATWGMRMMAIELRDKQGHQLSKGDALAHTAGYSISLAVFPLQIISVIMMLTSARGQGLTDHLLGTTALNKRL